MGERPRPLFRYPPPGLDVFGKPLKASTPGGARTQEEIEKEWEELTKRERQLELPFLYGWKWYKWAREFYESTNRINLLCAANQISKSSTQIRKCINWATDQNIWPSLWPRKPIQFWYLYPTQKQVNAEFETKWKLFLPSGDMKDDSYYGYTVEKTPAGITAIHFSSGVHVYFKTYSQNVQALQTGTCDAIFCDEELPMDLYSELTFRLAASNGYFHMVFTATLGQDFWRLALEPLENETEGLPHAFKQTVSLYDSQHFEDGTPSHWTTERIKEIEMLCKSMAEIQKRVHGRFILAGGRKYEEFDMYRHLKEAHFVPATWGVYAAADPGSGGSKEEHHSPHYPALVYVAVSPDYKRGRVFLGWIGDDGTRYTAGDVVEKHMDLKKIHKLKTYDQRYDFASRDFFEIAKRNDEVFEKAEKKHDIGVPILNTLFKNDMLYIYDTPELRKLAKELSTLQNATLKRNAKDNFADALRYACATIPWDWTAIHDVVAVSSPDKHPDEPLEPMQQQILDRRKAFEDEQTAEQQRIDDEFNEWNDAYGS